MVVLVQNWKNKLKIGDILNEKAIFSIVVIPNWEWQKIGLKNGLFTRFEGINFKIHSQLSFISSLHLVIYLIFQKLFFKRIEAVSSTSVFYRNTIYKFIIKLLYGY